MTVMDRLIINGLNPSTDICRMLRHSDWFSVDFLSFPASSPVLWGIWISCRLDTLSKVSHQWLEDALTVFLSLGGQGPQPNHHVLVLKSMQE